jgi:glycosyltransferase involved in cell wall biosynthesis
MRKRTGWRSAGTLRSGKPRISIGVPVFNGEKYIREALDSILAQTYQDFELIISDNASTDLTQQICRDYAAKDNRIHYYRNEENLGAPKNYNRVFALSSGEYFKWAAYDDVLAPEFLQKCVSVLDQDNSVALCHSKTARIDEHGAFVGNYDERTLMKIRSSRPHERFGDLISIRNPCWQIFGVIRASLLRMTTLHGNYVGADRNLLAEMGLLGRMHEIPEYLFFRRDHPQAYTRTFCEHDFAIDVNNYRAQMLWWTGRGDGATNFPNWKRCLEFLRSVQRIPLKWSERLLCYEEIWKWFAKEGWMFVSSDIENLLLRRSRFARKLVPAVRLNLGRTVIPFIRKMRR